jgi:hypothetical protein
MKLESKYDTGHVVSMISYEEAKRVVECSTCLRTGKVKIGEEEFICPKCNGRSVHIQWNGRKWFVKGSSEVGKIQIVFQTLGYESNDEPHGRPHVTYMLAETGVGSGQIWGEKDLFASREDAQIECDKRNGVLKPGVMSENEFYRIPETK